MFKLQDGNIIRFRQLIEKESFHHVLFWTLLYFFLVIIDQLNHPLWLKFTKELVNVLLYMIVVYANLRYLIPHLLSEKKILIYAISMICLAIVITPFKVLIFYFLYSNYPEMQAHYVENQHILLIIFLFLGFVSTIFKVMSDWWSHQRATKELENKNLQSELKFLRGQINPHFLFNTLNNLYALTLKKSDLAPDMVLRLSEMMRYMLYECNVKEVPLSNEIKYLQNYLELEKLRHGEKMNIEFNIRGEVEGQKIAPLIFIPFVENSFKHGLDQQIDSGYIKINIDISDEKIQMDIENSKAPKVTKIVNESAKKSGGIGLQNIQRRLKLIYPDKHLLHIDDRQDIFSIKLNLELN